MATGWAEVADSKGNENQLGEDDDLDGLSQEQLQAIRTISLDSGAPVDAQYESNDQATAWGEQWGSKLAKVEEVQWPIDM